jgi:hypothetical protein
VFTAALFTSHAVETDMMPSNQRMDQENVVFTHNGALFIHEGECNLVICKKMDQSGDHYVEQIKPNSERQGSCFLLYVESKREKDMNVDGGPLRKREGMEGGIKEGNGVKMVKVHCMIVWNYHIENYYIAQLIFTSLKKYMKL